MPTGTSSRRRQGPARSAHAPGGAGAPAASLGGGAAPAPLGATPLPDGGCAFRVWAPLRERVAVRLLAPAERIVELERTERGYFRAVVDDVPPGARYLYRLDGDVERPDPASRHQPEGVHGPSQVVDLTALPFSDPPFGGVPLADCVFYELHVGTFSEGGTLDSAIAGLDRLVELGVTVVELMPVAQFPGARNWGYDGVDLFAVQDSYGGPQGLARFVDACHARDLGVCLDVVYNHLGPEGNYLRDFGPYFTDAYHTPWGEAVNLDDAGSDDVRRFLADNALQWLRDYRIDMLRLDAVHAFMDRSARPFLQQLAEETRALADESGRALHLIAESDLNDRRLIREPERGGYGLDAQWSDDFHHAAHALLTGEDRGYYQDYGTIDELARALRLGWVFTGQYSAYRGRAHGNDPSDLPSERFVVCVQNHDQVGNRMRGDRLSALVDAPGLRVAAVVNLLSPFLPLLFMGEEYGETAPFPYFVDHSDPELVRAVREGRKREFSGFEWGGEPPDPQAPETFASARLSPSLRHDAAHAGLYALYRRALELRRRAPALAGARASGRDVEVRGDVVLLGRTDGAGGRSLLVVRVAERDAGVTSLDLPAGEWRVVLDTEDEAFGGGGAATAGASLELRGRHAVLLVDGAGQEVEEEEEMEKGVRGAGRGRERDTSDETEA